MKVLIRKDSSDIRNRLERLGYTASEKALEGFGDGIFVDKSDNTFHVKSEWNVIYSFVKGKEDEWEVELTMFISGVLGDEMFKKFKND